CTPERTDPDPVPVSEERFALGSIVIDADGNRTTYVQVLTNLDGPFDNTKAVEVPGNGVILAQGSSFFMGLTEEPTWVRYGVDAEGRVTETGRISLFSAGVSRIDYGNAIVDAQTAVSVFSDPPLAVVWNPETMTIKGQIPLPHLVKQGYELEVWTTVAHGGRVYVPGRFSDWTGARIFPGVSLTILDPAKLEIVGVAEDDRCASGGRPVFDANGYAYVMGDGRTWSIHMFAEAAGAAAPRSNCLLRIAPGATDFEANWFYEVPSLTGGLESIGELETPAQDTGVGFSKIFHRDQLPANVKPVDFNFWSLPVHKLWRFTLGDVPKAEVVDGIPFSVIGFGGSPFRSHLWTGESNDMGATSEVYEIDPATNTASKRFTMAGYFNGLYPLTK
ncbi:MAG TPA: hypothetical protein VGE37_10830, partial [Archangium sp.]